MLVKLTPDWFLRSPRGTYFEFFIPLMYKVDKDTLRKCRYHKVEKTQFKSSHNTVLAPQTFLTGEKPTNLQVGG